MEAAVKYLANVDGEGEALPAASGHYDWKPNTLFNF